MALLVSSASRSSQAVPRASFLLRRPFALLALACAMLPPVAHAQDEEGCIPSPEDGIFCGEDPGGFELFSYSLQTISGEVTEPWYVAGSFETGFSYNRFGLADLIFDYDLTAGSRLTVAGSGGMYLRGSISGEGSFRLLAGGSLLFDRTGSLIYQRILAPYTAYFSHNTYSGGTEIAGGWLKIYDDASLGTGALTLSEGGRLQTLDTGSLRGFMLTGSDNVIQADYALSIDGVISGDGRLNKQGAGTVTLTQANTYAGGTQVAEGTLAVSTDANLGAADTRVSLAGDTTLRLAGGFDSSQREIELQGTHAQVTVAAGSATWHGATAGAGQLVKEGAGTLTLAGGIGHTGGADIAAGTLEVAVSSTLGGTGMTSWSGPVTGSGAFVKSGDGTLVLSGTATHSGATIVRGGTLQTVAANVLSASSALFLINGATLDLAGHDQTVGDLDSYNAATQQTESSTVDLGGATLTSLTRVINLWAGSLTGSGTLVKKGSAEMKWYAANSFSGEFRIEAGTVSAQAARVFSPNAIVQVASGTALKLNDHAQTIAGLGGAGSVLLGSATLTLNQSIDETFSGAISGTGAVVKSGSGTLTLAGAQSFSGGLTLAGGTVSVAVDASLGQDGAALTLAGGTLATTATFTSDRAIALTSASTIRTTGGTLTLSGALTGSAALTKTGAGSLVLSADNHDFTGTTTIAAGTLTLGHGAGLGQSGAVVIASGATLDAAAHGFDLTRISGAGTLTGSGAFSHDATADRSLATILAGTARLTKSGSGTLTLSGASTYSGRTTVAAGRLVVDGSIAASSLTTVASGATLAGHGAVGALTIASGATLAPGNSPGPLTAGDTTFEEGGTFQFELNNASGSAGANWDVLAVNGTLTLSATAESPFMLDLTSLTLANAAGDAANFSSAADYSFTFLTTTGGVSGFSSNAFTIDTSHFSNPFTGTWSVSLTNSGHDLSLNYTASAVPEPSTYAALAGLAALGLAALRGRRRAAR